MALLRIAVAKALTTLKVIAVVAGTAVLMPWAAWGATLALRGGTRLEVQSFTRVGQNVVVKKLDGTTVLFPANIVDWGETGTAETLAKGTSTPGHTPIPGLPPDPAASKEKMVIHAAAHSEGLAIQKVDIKAAGSQSFAVSVTVENLLNRPRTGTVRLEANLRRRTTKPALGRASVSLNEIVCEDSLTKDVSFSPKSTLHLDISLKDCTAAPTSLNVDASFLDALPLMASSPRPVAETVAQHNPTHASMSDDTAKVLISAVLLTKGIEVAIVQVVDGRPAGGTKQLHIGYVSRATSVVAAAEHIGMVLGAFLGAVREGFDCDELIAFAGTDTRTVRAIWRCDKQWRDQYLNGTLSAKQVGALAMATLEPIP